MITMTFDFENMSQKSANILNKNNNVYDGISFDPRSLSTCEIDYLHEDGLLTKLQHTVCKLIKEDFIEYGDIIEINEKSQEILVTCFEFKTIYKYENRKFVSLLFIDDGKICHDVYESVDDYINDTCYIM